MISRNSRNRGGGGIRGKRPSGTYTVGYGKPPQGTKFRKGQSGNISGVSKTKKIKLNGNIVTKVLSRSIKMTEGGVTKHIIALEAVYQKRLELALKGNMRAILSIAADAREHGLLIDPNQLPNAMQYAGERMKLLSDVELRQFEDILRKFVEASKKDDASGLHHQYCRI